MLKYIFIQEKHEGAFDSGLFSNHDRDVQNRSWEQLRLY